MPFAGLDDYMEFVSSHAAAFNYKDETPIF